EAVQQVRPQRHVDLEAGAGLERLGDVEAPFWMVPGVARFEDRLDAVDHHPDPATRHVAERVVVGVHVTGLEVALLQLEVDDHGAGRDRGQGQRSPTEVDLAFGHAPAGEGRRLARRPGRPRGATGMGHRVASLSTLDPRLAATTSSTEAAAGNASTVS